MKTFICPTCNKGEVKDLARTGRRMHFRNIPDLEVPADVVIPTCTNPDCGEEWIDGAVAARVDEVMKTAYQAALTIKAEEAISKLKKKAPQRDLERLLGLSAGYLSKLKHGKETTAPLVVALMLLASDPRRVDELRSLWSMELPQEPPSIKVIEIATRQKRVPHSLPLPTPGIAVKLKPESDGPEFVELRILSANA
jgi:transcriptional regulator with XRE-family HTH domain